MCYKGGPRCANHLKPKISALQKKISDGDKSSHTSYLHREAVQEYNGTRTGQKALKEKLENTDHPFQRRMVRGMLLKSAEERKRLLRERRERENNPRLQKIHEDMSTLSKNLENFNDGLSSNYLGSHYGNIKTWAKPWTKDEEENLEKVNQIAKVLSQKKPDFEEAQKIMNSMADIDKTQSYQTSTFDGKTLNEHNRRDKNLKTLAEDMYKKRFSQEIPPPYEKAPQREPNTRLTGLKEAQASHLGHYNYAFDSNVMGHDHQKLLDPTLDRIADGEKYTAWTGEEYESTSLVPQHDRFMNEISQNPQLYLSTAFPDVELKKSMDKQKVDNVSVTPFYNGREEGNAYTVITPDGSTRTFSVYEHRNSDSIIINGKTNWRAKDKDELPYSGDHKGVFFAEFHPKDKQQCADALAFYMKEAQKGELPSDAHLASTAGRRDWNSILSESIPGYTEWLKKQNIDISKPETNDDILRRLDFDPQ